jgi:hypothetical protein
MRAAVPHGPDDLHVRSRRSATLALALAVAALPAPATAVAASCPARPAEDPRVPAFAPGAGPASNGRIGAYLTELDRASARVVAGVAGTSVQGRPLRYAIAGDPALLRPGRLAAVLARLRRVRQGTASAAELRRSVRVDPAIVWVAGSVHSNEPSGADADLVLLHDLAARTDCAARARLRRVLVVVMPVQNPDGRAAGTRTNAAGFDLNRDWFAATQPETAARLGLLQRLPPVALVDQHEQGGATSFVPPNADPIHHEIPRGALDAIDDTFAPALRTAFTRHGWPVDSGRTFDLFFMGYGDAAPATMMGTASMTVEVGAGVPYRRRAAEHLAAAEAVVDTAARHRRALLAGWAATARDARAQGARGVLQPNRVWRAGDVLRFGIPAQRVYAYALAASPDADALAGRLLAQGVRVQRLRVAVDVAALDPFGPDGPAPQSLAAGTYVIPMAQAAKHWVQATLGDDAYVPFPYFYDVSAWSQPLLMDLGGGALREPLPAGAALEPVTVAPGPPPVAPPAAGTVLRGDDARSLGVALALLRQGIALRRVPGTGEIATPDGTAGATAVLRAARVALLADPGSTTAVAPGDPVPTLSPGWCRWVLEQRLGLAVDVLDAADVANGRLGAGGYTALVVPDGQELRGGLDAAGLERVGAFVRGGGTYVGWRARGITLAAAAGVTSAAANDAGGLRVAGAAIRIELDTADPVAWGFTAGGPFVLDQGDPVLAAGSGIVGRFPPAGRLWRSGYATGESAIHDTAAVIHERAGAGDVVLFSFDPAFRGYTEGTERLLANALLLPSA